ncbi:hypothetical protein CSAL01_00973 [Colletotrichum salicis]|uniref:Uncharacterized protein n=1 Tax=Colletotrichum salicis TaxID=1209931 RepID=A0A135UNP9_9PEZI|nr:hypothetical protein CSAL01_00973 [Colletotrichum salicis]
MLSSKLHAGWQVEQPGLPPQPDTSLLLRLEERQSTTGSDTLSSTLRIADLKPMASLPITRVITIIWGKSLFYIWNTNNNTIGAAGPSNHHQNAIMARQAPQPSINGALVYARNDARQRFCTLSRAVSSDPDAEITPSAGD